MVVPMSPDPQEDSGEEVVDPLRAAITTCRGDLRQALAQRDVARVEELELTLAHLLRKATEP
jgi:hypothetical protein